MSENLKRTVHILRNERCTVLISSRKNECTGIRYVIEKIEKEWKRIRIWCVFLCSKKEKTWLII